MRLARNATRSVPFVRLCALSFSLLCPVLSSVSLAPLSVRRNGPALPPTQRQLQQQGRHKHDRSHVHRTTVQLLEWLPLSCLPFPSGPWLPAASLPPRRSVR
jgi:hypothetical protein